MSKSASNLIAALLLLLSAFADRLPDVVVPLPWNIPGVTVPAGPYRVLIVRETANSAINGVLVSLRGNAEAKAYAIDTLDLDAKDKDGAPLARVAEFKAKYPAIQPPALAIAGGDGKPFHAEPLPSTADAILAAVKAKVGK